LSFRVIRQCNNSFDYEISVRTLYLKVLLLTKRTMITKQFLPAIIFLLLFSLASVWGAHPDQNKVHSCLPKLILLGTKKNPNRIIKMKPDLHIVSSLDYPGESGKWGGWEHYFHDNRVIRGKTFYVTLKNRSQTPVFTADAELKGMVQASPETKNIVLLDAKGNLYLTNRTGVQLDRAQIKAQHKRKGIEILTQFQNGAFLIQQFEERGALDYKHSYQLWKATDGGQLKKLATYSSRDFNSMLIEDHSIHEFPDHIAALFFRHKDHTIFIDTQTGEVLRKYKYPKRHITNYNQRIEFAFKEDNKPDTVHFGMMKGPKHKRGNAWEVYLRAWRNSRGGVGVKVTREPTKERWVIGEE